jgi:Ca2+-binding RTX toxin-like protein
MALFGKGRSRKRLLTVVMTAGSVVAVQALTTVPAGAVLLGGCTYNPATQSVTIQQQTNDQTTLGVVDVPSPGTNDEIQITADTGGGPQDCGSATTANTTSVVVLGSGVNATNEEFVIDNDVDGSFGSIAFSIDMGNHGAAAGDGDVVAWIGTSGKDNVKVTNTTFETNGGTGTVVGTEFLEFYSLAQDDTIDAAGVTSIPLLVESGDGDDTITTGGGNDNCLTGKNVNGNCTGYYDGGAGEDWITTGTSRADGQDEYYGGADFDTLDAHARTAPNWMRNSGAYESGEGTCFGAAPGCEGDYIFGDVESLISGSGNDRLEASVGGTWLNGQAGDDTFDANNFAGVVLDYSTVNSASSPDLTIDLDNGTIMGWGSDTITGDPGTLGVVGGDGNDTFLITDDTSFNDFCGGPGTGDTVDASATEDGVVIDLTGTAPNPDAFDSFGNCGTPAPGSADSTENIIGGTGDDTLIGNTLANMVTGGDGNDLVFGSPNIVPALLNDGRDWLEGGNGNDSFFGGTGADTVSFKNCGVAPTTTARGGSTCPGITADISLGFAEGEGSDTIVDYIEIVEGSKAGDKIKTGPTGLGSSVNTWIRGFGGGDQLTGSDGNDQIAGGGGNDRIRSGAGDDDLLGAGGNDKFWGGGGVDSADGGAGKNTCKGVEIRKNCKKMKNNRAVSFAAKLARLD